MKLSLILFLLLSSISFAAEPSLPILIISDNGYAWMIQDSNGKPVLYEFAQVLIIGKPSVPVPPTSTFGLEKPIRDLVAQLSASGKADLVAVRTAISEVAKMAISVGNEPPKLKTVGEVEAVAKAMLIMAIKDKIAWTPIATEINNLLIKLQADKKIVTAADYGKALEELVRAMQ